MSELLDGQNKNTSVLKWKVFEENLEREEENLYENVKGNCNSTVSDDSSDSTISFDFLSPDVISASFAEMIISEDKEDNVHTNENYSCDKIGLEKGRKSTYYDDSDIVMSTLNSDVIENSDGILLESNRNSTTKRKRKRKSTTRVVTRVTRSRLLNISNDISEVEPHRHIKRQYQNVIDIDILLNKLQSPKKLSQSEKRAMPSWIRNAISDIRGKTENILYGSASVPERRNIEILLEKSIKLCDHLIWLYEEKPNNSKKMLVEEVIQVKESIKYQFDLILQMIQNMETCTVCTKQGKCMGTFCAETRNSTQQPLMKYHGNQDIAQNDMNVQYEQQQRNSIEGFAEGNDIRMSTTNGLSLLHSRNDTNRSIEFVDLTQEPIPKTNGCLKNPLQLQHRNSITNKNKKRVHFVCDSSIEENSGKSSKSPPAKGVQELRIDYSNYNSNNINQKHWERPSLISVDSICQENSAESDIVPCSHSPSKFGKMPYQHKDSNSYANKPSTLAEISNNSGTFNEAWVPLNTVTPTLSVYKECILSNTARKEIPNNVNSKQNLKISDINTPQSTSQNISHANILNSENISSNYNSEQHNNQEVVTEFQSLMPFTSSSNSDIVPNSNLECQDTLLSPEKYNIQDKTTKHNNSGKPVQTYDESNFKEQNIVTKVRSQSQNFHDNLEELRILETESEASHFLSSNPSASVFSLSRFFNGSQISEQNDAVADQIDPSLLTSGCTTVVERFSQELPTVSTLLWEKKSLQVNSPIQSEIDSGDHQIHNVLGSPTKSSRRKSKHSQKINPVHHLKDTSVSHPQKKQEVSNSQVTSFTIPKVHEKEIHSQSLISTIHPLPQNMPNVEEKIIFQIPGLQMNSQSSQSIPFSGDVFSQTENEQQSLTTSSGINKRVQKGKTKSTGTDSYLSYHSKELCDSLDESYFHYNIDEVRSTISSEEIQPSQTIPQFLAINEMSESKTVKSPSIANEKEGNKITNSKQYLQPEDQYNSGSIFRSTEISQPGNIMPSSQNCHQTQLTSQEQRIRNLHTGGTTQSSQFEYFYSQCRPNNNTSVRSNESQLVMQEIESQKYKDCESYTHSQKANNSSVQGQCKLKGRLSTMKSTPTQMNSLSGHNTKTIPILPPKLPWQLGETVPDSQLPEIPFLPCPLLGNCFKTDQLRIPKFP